MSRQVVQHLVETVPRTIIAQEDSRFILAPGKHLIGNDGRYHNFIYVPVKNVLRDMG
jgi:hypothetical protein